MSKKKKYDKWDIESAASTLRRAKEIEGDPELEQLAREQIKCDRDALNAILQEEELEEKTAKKLNKVFGDPS